MDKKDIFISFNNNDRKYVDELVSILKWNGISCWYQINDSRQEYMKAIAEGMKNSENFVVIVSKNSAKSHNVELEVQYATAINNKNKSFNILPVIIDDTDMINDTEALGMLLNSYNILYSREYKSTNELVLKIIDQLRIVKKNFNRDSIYSLETDEEAERLIIQNRFLANYAKPIIDKALKNIKNVSILDVGCAKAEYIFQRIGNNKYESLLGIDKDKNSIDYINGINTDKRNSFLCLDIENIDFANKKPKELFDYMNEKHIQGFSFIHISSVLLHLKNPEKVLNNLRNLLSDDGIIFIQEEDDSLNLAYPESHYFEDCFFLYDHSLESGDRNMARKIPVFLRKANFNNISLEIPMCTSLDFGGKYKEDLWDLYFNPNYWAANDASYFDDIAALDSLNNCIKYHDKVKKDFMDDKIFISLGFVYYTATK